MSVLTWWEHFPALTLVMAASNASLMSVFAIVWIHIFPFWCQNVFENMLSPGFYNDQELGLLPLALLLKLIILLALKIDQIIANLDFWQHVVVVCWQIALGPLFSSCK